MSLWRYNKHGQPSDPVDLDTLLGLLRAGTVPPGTLVWKEGMRDWTPASAVPELNPPAPPTTPTLLMSLPDPNSASGAQDSSSSRSSSPDSAPPAGGPPPMAAAPPMPGADQLDIDQNKVFAVLAYIWILFLVPLLAAPKSRFARYHTNQGIVLFIANIIASFATVILVSVLSFIPIIGCFAWIVAVAVPVGLLVLMILGIVNAASGLYKPLPLIGHFEIMN